MFVALKYVLLLKKITHWHNEQGEQKKREKKEQAQDAPAGGPWKRRAGRLSTRRFVSPGAEKKKVGYLDNAFFIKAWAFSAI
jgi:hypothetical protein